MSKFLYKALIQDLRRIIDRDVLAPLENETLEEAIQEIEDCHTLIIEQGERH